MLSLGMANEFEIVRSDRISHFKVFINELEYRTSHMHSEFEIIYVVGNPLIVRFPGDEYVIKDRDAFIINPNQVHMLEKEKDASTFICIQFSPTLFKDIYPTLMNMRFKMHNIIEPETERTLLKLARSYQDLDGNMNLEIFSLLSHLVYLIINNTPYTLLSAKEKEEEINNIQRISRLLSFIDSGYTHKINLSDFARDEGLTLSYLSHFAKKVLSEPFQDYVNFLRFNYAKKLIATGNMNLAEAAYESGFSDPRYLSRAFIKYTGMNQKEWKELNKRDESVEHDMRTHISAHSLERMFSRRKSIEMLDTLLRI